MHAGKVCTRSGGVVEARAFSLHVLVFEIVFLPGRLMLAPRQSAARLRRLESQTDGQTAPRQFPARTGRCVPDGTPIVGVLVWCGGVGRYVVWRTKLVCEKSRRGSCAALQRLWSPASARLRAIVQLAHPSRKFHGMHLAAMRRNPHFSNFEGCMLLPRDPCSIEPTARAAVGALLVQCGLCGSVSSV
jgi:hypothetical protein